MSDLSADEARRAAEWLESIGWPESARELRKYADPPETVESLRAELAAEREELVIAQGMASDVRAALENWQRRAVAAEEDRVSLNVELAEAGYLVVHQSDTDEGRAAAQVDPGGKHDAWLEARSGPHG